MYYRLSLLSFRPWKTIPVKPGDRTNFQFCKLVDYCLIVLLWVAKLVLQETGYVIKSDSADSKVYYNMVSKELTRF